MDSVHQHHDEVEKAAEEAKEIFIEIHPEAASISLNLDKIVPQKPSISMLIPLLSFPLLAIYNSAIHTLKAISVMHKLQILKHIKPARYDRAKVL